MSSCGRKEDSIWQYFHKSVTPGKAGCRATCRFCPKEMQGIPSRLRLHLTQCTGVVNNPHPVMTPIRSDPTMPPAGIVAKRKRSFEQLDGSFQPPSKNMKSSASVSSYFVTTTAKERKSFDLQIATMIYATNAPLRFVDLPDFLKADPGYTACKEKV